MKNQGTKQRGKKATRDELEEHNQLNPFAKPRRAQGGFMTSFPLRNLVQKLIHGLVDLSLTQATRGRENLEKDEENDNGRGEEARGLPPPTNRAYYTFP